MSDCPGYLAVIINDREEGDELFKYDSIISCPPHFDFSFKIPHFGPNKDKTFDVLFDDAKTQYRVFLTHVNFEELKPTAVPVPVVLLPPLPGEFPVLLLCIVAVAIVLIVCVSTFIYLDITHRKITQSPESTSFYDAPVDTNNRIDSLPVRKDKSDSSCCGSIRHMNTSKMTIVIFYIIFKVIYSFVFTFSVFFTVIVLCVGDDLAQLSRVNATQVKHHNESAAIHKKVQQHVQHEVERQLHHAHSMQLACQYYLTDVTTTLAMDIDNKTNLDTIQDFLINDNSITNVFRAKFSQTINSYMDDLDIYRKSYDRKLNDSLDYFLRKYNAYLDRAMYENPWLLFWRDLFNHRKTHRHGDEFTSPISSATLKFANYAELPESIAVELWPIQFWQRYVMCTFLYLQKYNSMRKPFPNM